MIRILHKDFENAYKILDESFPFNEIRPFDEQKELLANSLYKLYGINENEELIAVMAVWEFEEFIFIEHLAVSSKHRNKNVGTGFLKKIISEKNKKICLEVEPPEDEIKKRRIGFYERNGFFLNKFPYVQPPISEGKNPVPLMIMTTGSEITEQEFNHIRKTLYYYVYKQYESQPS